VVPLSSLSAEGRELANRFRSECIETSAKQRVNVEEAFFMLVRAIKKYNKVRASTRSLSLLSLA
jgi:GTPase SAR1 family protein